MCRLQHSKTQYANHSLPFIRIKYALAIPLKTVVKSQMTMIATWAVVRQRAVDAVVTADVILTRAILATTIITTLAIADREDRLGHNLEDNLGQYNHYKRSCFSAPFYL